MNDRIGVGVIITSFVGIALMLGVSVAAVSDTSDALAIAEVVESFRRLAVLAPDVAGAVWMSEAAYEDWDEVITRLDDHATGGSVWFVHTVPLAEKSEDGSLHGGLYSPWLGVLLLLELDENAATITGFSLHPVTEPIEPTSDPVELAVALMASIEAGSAAFERAADLVGEEDRSTFVARVGDYDEALSAVYSPNSATGRMVEGVLDRLYTGDFAGPLSLLGEEDEEWIASLAPVWFAGGARLSIVVLASTASSFNLAWLEIDEAKGGDVQRVSLIRLFDGVTTRGGEAS